MEKFEKKRDRWWWWKKKEQESAEAISGLKICFCILAYKCTFMILRKILKKTFFKMPLKICKGPPFFTFLTFFLKLDIKSQGEICMNFFRKIVGSPYEKWKKDSLEHSKMHIGSFFKNFYTFWNASYLVLEIENFEKSSPFFIWIFL